MAEDPPGPIDILLALVQPLPDLDRSDNVLLSRQQIWEIVVAAKRAEPALRAMRRGIVEER